MQKKNVVEKLTRTFPSNNVLIYRSSDTFQPLALLRKKV